MAIAETVHGCFLARNVFSAEDNEGESESDDETDEDDYNFELGGSGGITPSHSRLKKSAGRVLTVT